MDISGELEAWRDAFKFIGRAPKRAKVLSGLITLGALAAVSWSAVYVPMRLAEVSAENSEADRVAMNSQGVRELAAALLPYVVAPSDPEGSELFLERVKLLAAVSPESGENDFASYVDEYESQLASIRDGERRLVEAETSLAVARQQLDAALSEVDANAFAIGGLHLHYASAHARAESAQKALTLEVQSQSGGAVRVAPPPAVVQHWQRELEELRESELILETELQVAFERQEAARVALGAHVDRRLIEIDSEIDEVSDLADQIQASALESEQGLRTIRARIRVNLAEIDSELRRAEVALGWTHSPENQADALGSIRIARTALLELNGRLEH